MAESGAEKDTLEEHLEKTDLMQTHYSNEEFNSYSSGPGSRLPRQQQINRGVLREASRENIRLYIGTWPLDLTEQALGNLFSNVCKVISIYKGRPKLDLPITFGFVEVGSMEDAQRLITRYHNFRVDKFHLKVEIASSKAEVERRKIERMQKQSFYNDLAGDEDESAQLVNESCAKRPTSTSDDQRRVLMERRRLARAAAMLDPTAKPCSYCQVPSKYQCPVCKTNYCSRQCQAADWGEHRHLCVPYKPTSRAEPVVDLSKVEDSQIEVTEEALEKVFGIKIVRNGVANSTDEEAEVASQSKKVSPKQAAIRVPEKPIERESNIQKKVAPAEVKTPLRAPLSNPTRVEPQPEKTQPKVSGGQAEKSEFLDPDIPIPNPDISSVVRYFDAGDVVSCRVVDAHSPSQFWIHIDHESLLQLTALNKSLDAHYKDMPPKKAFKPTGSKLYAAKFPDDGSFYRAQVLDIGVERLQVLYLDYGNIRSVPLNYLHPLESLFYSLPFQAVQCSLADAVPVGPQWRRKAFKVFAELVTEAELKGRIVSSNKACPVLLQLKKNNVNIGPQLVKEGLAVRRDFTIPPKQPSPAQSPVVQPPVVRTPPKPSPVVQKELPEVPVPNCPSPSITPTAPPKTAEVAKVELKKELPQLQFDRSQKHQVTIMATGPSWLCVLLARDLKQFVSILTDLKTQIEPYSGRYEPKEAGELLAALSEADPSWYRARFVARTPKGFEVEMLDYGSTECLPAERLAPLPSEFMQYPPLAVKCSLAGTSTLAEGQSWPDLSSFQFEMETVKDGVKLSFDGGDLAEMLLETEVLLPAAAVEEPGITADSLAAVEQPAIAAVDASVEEAEEEVQRLVREIPTEKLRENEAVKVCYASSLSEIYVTKVSTALYLEKIMQALQKDGHKEYAAVLGELVIAQSVADKVWYRASVREVSTVNKKALVQYVDFGNTETVPFLNLSPLSPELAELPAQAVPIKLDVNIRAGCEEKVVALLQELSCKLLGVTEDNTIGDMVVDGRLLMVELDERGLSVKKERKKVPGPEDAAIAPAAVLPSGVRVSIAWANSPDDFYVHDAREEAVNTMHDLLIKCASLVVDTAGPFYPKRKGQLVMALYENTWSRATVLHAETEEWARVFFVDFGNVASVPCKQLRPVPPALLEIPAQAVHCAMPLKGKDGSWSEDVIGFFKQLESHKFTLQLLPEQKGGAKQIADLRVDGHEDSSVMEMFVQEGYADSCDPTVTSCPTPAAPQKPLPQVTYFQMEQLPVAEWPSDVVDVTVSLIQSPDSFFCQIATPESLLKIKTYIEGLNLHCVSMEANADFKPPAGSLCLTYVSTYQEWYRAAVEQVNSDGSYKLHLIDFGEEACSSRVLPVRIEDRSLAPFALRCKLHGVRPVRGGWSEAATVFCQEFSLDKILKSEVLEKGDTHCVCLRNETGSDMADLLITQGYARALDEVPSCSVSQSDVDDLISENAMLKKQLEALMKAAAK